MNEQTILIVEDDPTMQQLLLSHLFAHGYRVRSVTNGPEAFRLLQSETIHLVLLDIMLPGIDGLEVCRRIRAVAEVPIILITALHAPATKVTALDLGGDDYLTKPFDANELLARIRAVLRRARPDAAPLNVVVVDDLTIDLGRREAHRGGVPIHLTRIEFDLLSALVRHSDRTLTYRQLLKEVWGPGYEDIRSVHSHMSHLRRKLEGGADGPRYIQAVPGVGYRFRTVI